MTGLLVGCAVITTGLAIVRTVDGWNGRTAESRRVANWRELTTTGSRLGAPDARARIVVFSDFQCPFCRTMAGRLKEIAGGHPDSLTVVYRHSPGGRHPFAKLAAIASECAANQGRFEAFHDALFQRQDSIPTLRWLEVARQVGVDDLDAFERCVQRRETADRVERDIDAAQRIRVTATPSLIIGGRLYQGAIPTALLDSLTRIELSSVARKLRE